MSVQEKLMVVQQELNAPKNQYNSFGKYKYRSCEDILEGVKPILEKVKATLVVGDELQQIGERYYIKATATFTDAETGETVSNSAYAREEENKKGMDSSQVTGATSSYARKYALNGLFCIDDVKDSDATNKHGKDEGNTKIDKPKLNVIKRELERTGVSEKVLLDMFKINSIEEMDTTNFMLAMKKFEATPDKKKE